MLVFEMLVGIPPFYDQNMQRMYDKILHASLRFPSHVSPEARSLLSALLQRKVISWFVLVYHYMYFQLVN